MSSNEYKYSAQSHKLPPQISTKTIEQLNSSKLDKRNKKGRPRQPIQNHKAPN